MEALLYQDAPQNTSAAVISVSKITVKAITVRATCSPKSLICVLCLPCALTQHKEWVFREEIWWCCCCLFNDIVCNPAVVSRWTQVVILQLTSRPSESRPNPVVCFVPLCTAATAGNAWSPSQPCCPQGLQGSWVHKPHRRSHPHIWSKKSQQRHLWHSSLSRRVFASVLCPHVYQTPGLSLYLCKNSQRALCGQCWRAIPTSGPAHLCSPCWGDWECPFHGERMSDVTLGSSSAWAA